MMSGLTSVDWMLSGVAIFLVLLAIYAHVEGNRLAATRFVFHDIRRDVGQRPAHRIWWRAFTIAMGWRKRGHVHGTRRHARRNNITMIGGSRPR